MTYPSFKAEWLGRRVDYDHVYAYQCVDLILEYIKECYGISSGVWGNAIDYWTHPSAPLLKKFDKVATKSPRQGDIVVFNGLSGNPYGHIAIADRSASGGYVVCLEQNGQTGGGSGRYGDAIRLRSISTARIAGVLRPKASTPAPVYYTVRSGDTLTAIASRFGLTLTQLEKLNPVTNFKSRNYDRIAIGERVRVR